MIDVEVEVRGGLGVLAVDMLGMADTRAAAVTVLTLTGTEVTAVLARLAEAGVEVSALNER